MVCLVVEREKAVQVVGEVRVSGDSEEDHSQVGTKSMNPGKKIGGEDLHMYNAERDPRHIQRLHHTVSFFASWSGSRLTSAAELRSHTATRRATVV